MSEATPEQRKKLDAAEKAYQEAKKQKVDINLKVDNPSAERLADIIEQERSEKATPETKDEIIDDLQNKLFFAAQKEIERKRKAVGAPLEIDTTEKLMGFEIAKKGESSGTAPCDEKQGYYGNTSNKYDLNTPLAQRKFNSYAEMLSAIHDEEAVFQGSPRGKQASKYAEEIMKKFFAEHKQNNSPVPNLERPMPETVDVNGLRICKNPEDGDAQQWNKAFRRRKAIERAERGVVVGQEGEK